jgi:hypothetical protein
MLMHRPARFFCLFRFFRFFRRESDKNRARGAELDMTTCRTHESGGTPDCPAGSADLTRTGSGAVRTPGGAGAVRVPGGAGAVRVPGGAGGASLAGRTRYALAAARRARPPDLALLRRVRDGLKRL